jgi:hypothetical protein
LEELNNTIGVVGGELTTRNYSMEITFMAWIDVVHPQ